MSLKLIRHKLTRKNKKSCRDVTDGGRGAGDGERRATHLLHDPPSLHGTGAEVQSLVLSVVGQLGGEGLREVRAHGEAAALRRDEGGEASARAKRSEAPRDK